MSQTFPSVLPKFSQNLSGSADTNTVRTQMDSGRVRQRSRFATDQRSQQVSWNFTDLQFGIFQAWVLHKISNGADWFYIDFPTGGEGFKTVLARLADGKYAYTYDTVMYWNVTATLDVEDSLTWSEDVLDLVLAIGGDVGSINALLAAADSVEDLAASLTPYYTTLDPPGILP